MIWLGFVYNTINGTMSLPLDRIEEVLGTVTDFLLKNQCIRAVHRPGRLLEVTDALSRAHLSTEFAEKVGRL